MGMKRIVSTGFWDDDIVSEQYSAEDRYFMLYLLTNPNSKQCGIYHISRKTMAFEMGYSQETISSILKRFTTKFKNIVYSEETNEVAILNYLKHSVTKGGKPVEDCIRRELADVKDQRLIDAVYNHMKPFFDDKVKHGAVAYEGIEKVFEEYAQKERTKEKTYAYDNAYAYEESYNESYHESYDESSKHKRKRFTPPTFEEVQAYIVERGSSVDAKRFFDYYKEGNWHDRTGKPVKNWKQKLITWEQKDDVKPRKQVYTAKEMEVEELDINEIRRGLGLPEVGEEQEDG